VLVQRALSWIFVLAVATIPAFADNQEIAGWQDAKWGMTPEALQSVLKYPTRKADLSKVCGDKCDEGAALELDDYLFNGQRFMVRFWFAKSDVHLHTISMYAKQQNRDSHGDLFGTMKYYFQNAYGSPQDITLKNGHFIVAWVLPQTAITLYSNTTNETTVIYKESKGDKTKDAISDFNTHWAPIFGPTAPSDQ
jgi:hypothetical protein